MFHEMPSVGEYRGRALHAFQGVTRIQTIVVPEIDEVFTCEENARLLSIASDNVYSPEARLLAAERLLRPAEQFAHRRLKVPVNRDIVRAMVAGLNSLEWTDPEAYTSLLLPRNSINLPAARPEEHSAALRKFSKTLSQA